MTISQKEQVLAYLGFLSTQEAVTKESNFLEQHLWNYFTLDNYKYHTSRSKLLFGMEKIENIFQEFRVLVQDFNASFDLSNLVKSALFESLPVEDELSLLKNKQFLYGSYVYFAKDATIIPLDFYPTDKNYEQTLKFIISDMGERLRQLGDNYIHFHNKKAHLNNFHLQDDGLLKALNFHVLSDDAEKMINEFQHAKEKSIKTYLNNVYRGKNLTDLQELILILNKLGVHFPNELVLYHNNGDFWKSESPYNGKEILIKAMQKPISNKYNYINMNDDYIYYDADSNLYTVDFLENYYQHNYKEIFAIITQGILEQIQKRNYFCFEYLCHSKLKDYSNKSVLS